VTKFNIAVYHIDLFHEEERAYNAHNSTGCGFLLREGRRHSIYRKGKYRTQIPRHTEIVDELARKICKDLNIPFVK